ncbi:hypothetical protein [Reyranella sp.]|uniref:hypothetical protein n=1 Tax=Reyranella sp. TaxID=1929291 RepID=UPI002731F55C|nr:hypothetical protein [Reyranella sp.]MDP2377621.1 hypothetical protein [Reyranella sp.]
MGDKAVLPAPPEVVEGLRKSDKPERRFLRRLGMFSDMPDRGLFVLFVVVGFALIFFAKTSLWYLGFEGDYSIVIACGAAALMVLYGIFAYRMSNVRLRPDRLGDNFYYMGFVFTLASMSAALVQLQSGREVDALVGSFGIALFSTILGIAGRVAFIQMRTEVEDVEERVRQSLLAAADTLRGQLYAATRDLETFRVGVQQTIHERLTESADAFTRMTEAQVSHIRETVEGTIGSVQSAFAAHEQAAISLSQLGEKVTSSVDNLVTRIEAIHVPPSLLEAKMDALVAKLGATATAFERVAEADAGRNKDLAAASAELRRVVTQIAHQLGKLQTSAEELRTATNPATEMAASLARAREALDVTATAAKALGDSTLAARQASHELTGSIKAYGEMIVGITHAQQASAAASAAEADNVRRRMAQDLEESRAAVAEVQKVLADTARVVTQAINMPPSAPGQPP